MSEKDDIIEHDDQQPILIQEDENSRPTGAKTLTGNLRYFERAEFDNHQFPPNTGDVGQIYKTKKITTLQQEWHNMSTGELSWKDVPTIIE